MKKCPTYTATIYCGLRAGYAGPTTSPLALHVACQEYCNEVGLGLTIRGNTFIYTWGQEPGIEIGLIDYPRFPKGPDQVRHHALTLARRLMGLACQERVSVVFSDETIMLEADPK